jgi:hypothetical protein
MILKFIQDNNPVDPRQRFIPNAEIDVDTNAPSTPEPFLNDANWFSWLDGGALWGFLGTLGAIISFLWSIYAFLAYLLCIIFIVLYIYATIRKQEYDALTAEVIRNEEKRWDELYGARGQTSVLGDVNAYVSSENPNDWKLAIIEADILLADSLRDRGYVGDTLGERLRHITPNQLSSIDDAWEAHKVRNKIAHEGADFVLTKRIAEETINRYRRVLNELGVQ